ncbi:hypothetical protein NDU88_000674 [Pleurodeles waltl]|uniref:Uncharacterized protein n=1 Tax=Pleurodeles waltl TaxID=8319 RepID=A0AAV7N8M7_PLEWA|nr:hypothetical protein NDU88_000674 [Pleurodeles waltl]
MAGALPLSIATSGSYTAVTLHVRSVRSRIRSLGDPPGRTSFSSLSLSASAYRWHSSAPSASPSIVQQYLVVCVVGGNGGGRAKHVPAAQATASLIPGKAFSLLVLPAVPPCGTPSHRALRYSKETRSGSSLRSLSPGSAQGQLLQWAREPPLPSAPLIALCRRACNTQALASLKEQPGTSGPLGPSQGLRTAAFRPALLPRQSPPSPVPVRLLSRRGSPARDPQSTGGGPEAEGAPPIPSSRSRRDEAGS